MKKIEVGSKLTCIFNQPLPGNDIAPPLKLGDEYECKDIFFDKTGNLHIDVGIQRVCNFVTSYATGEILPGNVHWCHPNRFILKQQS